jgi:ParB/RepB/Spo0J family partition protein
MSDQITYLPLSALRESPFNPRKAFSLDALEELRSSIASQGIMQPIVARPLPDGQADIEHRYEIVFGHRRYRAASGLDSYANGDLLLPVILRDLDDQQAALAQVSENLQRADVSALEEADSFRHLHQAHNLSADLIAAKVGMSRSYVYARLKLAAAGHALRQAITADGLPPEVALEVARLRGDKLQTLALTSIRTDGEWQSQRTARRTLRALLTEHLVDAAPFNPEDPTLCKLAGRCSACPRRAGNDPDLAELPPQACTDHDCYRSKCAAHAHVATAALRRAGKPVISGDEARALFKPGRTTPSGWWPVDEPGVACGWRHDPDPDASGYAERTLADALADLAGANPPVQAPAQTTIVHPDTGLQWVCITMTDREQLQQRWIAHQHSKRQAQPAASGDRAPARPGSRMAPPVYPMASTDDWTEAERACTQGPVMIEARQRALAAMLTQPRTSDELRMMLLRELAFGDTLTNAAVVKAMGLGKRLADAAEEAEGNFDERSWWANTLPTLSADDVARLVVGVALADQISSITLYGRHAEGEKRRQAAEQVQLLAHYGVDVLAVAKEFQANQAAADTAEGDDDTATQGALPGLEPAAV